MSWPCWEWNLIELPRYLQNLPLLLNQLLFPLGISYSFKVILYVHANS